MKKVVLVRHGESIAQGFSRKQRWTAENSFLCDAELGSTGQAQALELCDGVRHGLLDFDVELVVCSPLTRAFQTAILAFGHLGVTVLPHPGIRELAPRGYGKPGLPQQPECTGRDVSDLQADARLQLPSVDWSLLQESPQPWWSNVVETQENVEQRLDDFCTWLSLRPEESVAVVCHFNVVQHLLRIRGLRVENCQPFICRVMGRLWSLHEERETGSKVLQQSPSEVTNESRPDQGSNTALVVEAPVPAVQQQKEECSPALHAQVGDSSGSKTGARVRRWG